jgi:hypothetical protein
MMLLSRGMFRLKIDAAMPIEAYFPLPQSSASVCNYILPYKGI